MEPWYTKFIITSTQFERELNKWNCGLGRSQMSMEQSISTQSMALLEGSSILRNLAIGDHWRCLNGLVDPQSFYFPALLHCCHGMSTLFHCEFLCLILVLRQGQPRWTEPPQKGTKITLSSLSIVYCRYFQRQKTNTDRQQSSPVALADEEIPGLQKWMYFLSS